MSSQADIILEDSSAEEHLKRLRLRKVYIKLRIPRVKAEIAGLRTRKKELSGSAGEASREVVEALIYSNQHLLELRKELEALELERKAVLTSLRDFKLLETGKQLPLTQSQATPLSPV